MPKYKEYPDLWLGNYSLLLSAASEEFKYEQAFKFVKEYYTKFMRGNYTLA